MASTPVHGKPHRLAPEQAVAVKNELGAILKSEHFAGAKRCHDFLEFVVKAGLAGDFENLTERTLGAELFGRPIDYETGSDAIVRVRANDVRRRLAEYYSKQARRSDVTISLPSGSYIPEFHWSTAERPATSTDPSDTCQSQADSATASSKPGPVAAQRRLKKPILIAASLLLAVIGGLALLFHHSTVPDPVKEFWGPIIHEHRPVIICFGNAVAFWPSVPVALSIKEGNQALLANPGPLVETRDDTVTVGNLRAAMSILNLLSGYGVPNELRWPQEIQMTELNRSNAIFIGAFNNPWSKSLNQGLRFSFKEIHTRSESIWWIQDRTSPNQDWSITKAYPEQMGPEYALITRIIDPENKRVEISVGGLTQFGNEAAGEFLSDETQMSAFARIAPKGWERRNVQIVLGMRIDGRKIINPRILAINVW